MRNRSVLRNLKKESLGQDTNVSLKGLNCTNQLEIIYSNYHHYLPCKLVQLCWTMLKYYENTNILQSSTSQKSWGNVITYVPNLVIPSELNIHLIWNLAIEDLKNEHLKKITPNLNPTAWSVFSLIIIFLLSLTHWCIKRDWSRDLQNIISKCTIKNKYVTIEIICIVECHHWVNTWIKLTSKAIKNIYLIESSFQQC